MGKGVLRMVDRAHFKNVLLQEKSRIEDGLKQSKEIQNNVSSELSQYDNHPADTATDLSDRGRQAALDIHQQDELLQIYSALDAIEAGTYGNCKVCGKEIPAERLEAIPTTLFCISHTTKSNLPNDRPVEEKVLHELFDNPYDTNDSFDEVARFGVSEMPSELSNELQEDLD